MEEKNNPQEDEYVEIEAPEKEHRNPFEGTDWIVTPTQPNGTDWI